MDQLREGGDENDAGKTVQLSLKLCLLIHRRFVVSVDTVSLNHLEKGDTNTIRLSVVVLVIIPAGLDVVADNSGTMIGESAHEQPVQEKLRMTMNPSTWSGRWRGVRLVSFARGSIVDERPVSAVVIVADDKVDGREQGREK